MHYPERITSKFVHNGKRRVKAPAVGVPPRLGGDAEVARSGVVIVGRADLRSTVADVVMVEGVARGEDVLIAKFGLGAVVLNNVIGS